MEEKKIQNIKNLLDKVSAISKKYEEIAKITGENFNIFKVMNVQSDEVRLHSAFITELLNPKGSHGQGDVFLKLFKNMFLKETDFITENASAEAEKYIGEINDEYTKGGCIDIIVTQTDNKRSIIIENKIYAGDQKNQLLRYYNYDTDAEIFYLTLYGEDPSNNSIGNGNLKKEDVKLLSYYNDIINWLEICKKETVNFPILRETIAQYINIIKYLTGQTMNEKKEQEIIDLISNKKYFGIANEIACGVADVKFNLIKSFWTRLIDQLEYEKIKNNPDENEILKCTENKPYEVSIYFTSIDDVEMYIWSNRDAPLYFGIEKDNEPEIYQSFKNDAKIEKAETELRAYAFINDKDDLILNDFTRPSTLNLFDESEMNKVIGIICDEINKFSRKVSKEKSNK